MTIQLPSDARLLGQRADPEFGHDYSLWISKDPRGMDTDRVPLVK